MFDFSVKKIDNNCKTASNSKNSACYIKQEEKFDSFECSKTNNKKDNKSRGVFNSFINKILGYKTDCTDGADDGKLSFKEKTSSFLRGCLNTFTNIVDSVIEHPVITTLSMGAVIGGSALLVAGGVVSAPVLAIGGAAMGLGFGAYNIGKGIYKSLKADNDADAKLAFEFIGEGTSDSLLSAFALKKGITGLKQMKKNSAPVKSSSENLLNNADDTLQNDRLLPEKVKSENALPAESSVKKQGELSLTQTDSQNAPAVIKNEPSVIKKEPAPVKKEPVVTKKEPEIIKNNASRYDYYEDDGIFGYDSSSSDALEECRARLEMDFGLADKKLKVVNLDPTDTVSGQLLAESKYSSLGTPRLNNKTNQYVYICENLKDAPDLNGLRGKTPLAGKNKKGLTWRLGKVKESGIKTIIDLRSKGECSPLAKQTLSEVGLDYVNFPVEDCNWSSSSLKDITSYIKAVNKGDFYVGCANGEGRTDLAVAINYLLNPKASNVPDFFFGSSTTSRVSVKENMKQLIDVVSNNKDIVKDWGWSDYNEFSSEFNKRFIRVLSKFKN